MRWLYKRGKIYHYRFTVGGREFTGSTECTDAATASIVLQQVRQECILGEHGIRKAPTLKAVAEGWIETKGRAVSPAHRRAAVQSLEALASLHRLPLTHITDPRVDDWRATYLETHSEASANLVLRYLKLWMRRALKEKLIRELPCDIRMGKPQQRERPIVDRGRLEEFEAAIAKGHRNPQVPAAVAFAMKLGLRESEVLGARWESIQGGVYVVTPKANARARTKSGKIRRVPIPQDVFTALGWMLCAKGGPQPMPRLGLIFPGTRGKMHVQGWLRQALKRGGIDGLGMHRLRATFATLHLRQGTNLKAVQEMLGHNDPRTTLIYQEVSLEEQARSQDELWRKA